MASQALRLCSGCRSFVRGPCPKCTAAWRARSDRRRGTSASRGYDHYWRSVVRPAFLEENPLCCLCPVPTLAEVPDHYPETRRSLVARGVTDPDAFERMRPLCLSCHARFGARD